MSSIRTTIFFLIFFHILPVNAQVKGFIETYEQESYILPGAFYYNLLGTDKRKEVNTLDGYLAPHFYLANEEIDTRLFKHLMIDVNPIIYARIKSDFSSPVRTPSFMPGGRIHWILPRNKTGITNLFGGYYHHSNGQDAPTLAKDAGDFIAPQFIGTNERDLNVYNGNFFDNYLFIGMDCYWKMENKSKRTFGLDKRYFYSSRISKLRFETHLLHYTFERQLLGYYPFYRSTIEFKTSRNIASQDESEGSSIVEKELDRLSIKIGFGYGDISKLQKPSLARRINAEASYIIRVTSSKNLGLNIRVGYNGTDPYNIYTERSNIFAMIGIATGNFLYKRELNLDNQ